MGRRRLYARLLSVPVLAALAAAAVLFPAEARAATWTVVTAADAASIDARVQDGFRVTSVDREAGADDLFAAALTRPARSIPQWWYPNLTLDEVRLKLVEHQAHLTRLEGYSAADGVRYSAVMSPSSSTPATSWWIGSRDDVLAVAIARRARIIDFEQHPSGQVSAVMVANSGTKARSWWLYHGQTREQISSRLAENGARLLDIEPNAAGLFDVVMLRDGTRSWWYAGKTAEELRELAAQNGARLTQVVPHAAGNQTLYAGIMVPNVSRRTQRVNELMRAAVGNHGAWGHHLKRVGGSTLQAINAGRAFEPASLVKVLLHLRAVDAFDGNLSALSTTDVGWFRGIDGSCPTADAPTSSSMSDVLRRMMQNSDNRTTVAVLNWAGGFAPVNDYATAIGAPSSSINHVIGCGEGARTAPNRLTLRDTGTMFERAANGTVLSRDAFRTFTSLMATSAPSRVAGIVRGRGASDGVEAVRGEATALRISGAMTGRFLARLQMAWKDGSYTLCDTTCRVHRTLGGWVSVPFKTRSGRVYTKQFSFAAFAENVPSSSGAQLAWDRSMEMLRPTLRVALESWKRAQRLAG